MAKPSIRCIKNCYLTVTVDGELEEQRFGFGQWIPVQRIEKIDDQYINIIIDDNTAIAGVQKCLFEMGNAPIVPYVEEEKPPVIDISLPLLEEDDE